MKSKLRCVLVDDDPSSHKVIGDFIAESPIAELTGMFYCPKKFLSEEPGLDFDLCLLDISMPHFNGFEVAEKLKKRNRQVIFISGVKEKIMLALELTHPIDVVPKPTQKQRLYSALEKAHALITHKNVSAKIFDYFHVAGENGKVQIRFSDIVYLQTDERDGRNKHVMLKCGTKLVLLRCNFESILSACPALIRVNKSVIVSIDECAKVEQDRITLRSATEKGKPKQVTLNRWYKKDFVKRSSSFIAG